MKKFLCALLIGGILLTLCGCKAEVVGHDGLIEAARKEIPLSGIEDLEILIAGSVDKGDRSLVWFITGNEYQAHGYYPMEFEVDEKQNDHFRFVHAYNAYERGTDMVSYPWEGYCFLVNNEACKTISLTYEDGRTGEIAVEQLPFLYHTSEQVQSYFFLDGEGKALPE